MPTKKTLALALSTFLDPATKEPVAITVLQNVLVGAVDAQHVSLRVIPEEAELLAVAQHLGSITLTLRNSDDVDVLEERGRATINTLVSGERARILQQKRFTTIQIIRGTGAPTEDMPPVTGTGTQAVPDLFLKHYGVNPTLETRHERFSTFAADVDTASYALARAWLSRGALPDESAVRVEEFVNAFDYAYRPPQTEAFAVQVEAFPSPSRPGYHLLHVGVQGQQVTTEQRRPANLVFAIDASGSMEGDQRLGLVKQALNLLVAQLKPDDTVAIVVYGTRAPARAGADGRNRSRSNSRCDRWPSNRRQHQRAGRPRARVRHRREGVW